MRIFLSSNQLIVSASWLAEHYQDPAIVIVDCRFSLADPTQGRQQYQNGHIPGAHYLDLNQDLSGPRQVHGGRHPLPRFDTLVAKLSSLGIYSQPPNGPTLVVAYDDSRLAFAARLWWLLRYLGHDHVAVLDGGFSGWHKAGYPTSIASPELQSGIFTPDLRSNWVVDREAVQRAQQTGDTVLIDSRESARYWGEHEPIDPIAGHIPGALSYPWQDVTNDQGYIYPVQTQQQRWATLPVSEDTIIYCGSGVTACVNLLSRSLAGLPLGKLYAGSWSDWCSYLVPPHS
jgi:thiosulfate/3-mercaptopyruvate sulfurtransferase